MRFDYTKFKDSRYKHYTQEDIADKIGISVSIVKNMESGRKRVKPDDENLIKMCEVLNLNINDYFVRDTKIITFFNNKGGVGKTSLVSNLASVLVSNFNKKILIIDCDAQANLTQNFRMDESDDYDEYNLYQAFTNKESIRKHIKSTGYVGLDIVVAHIDIGKIEPELPNLAYKEQRFKHIVGEVKDSGDYDFIFCDSSPVFSMFNNIILRSSDGVIIPFTPDPFSLGGIGNVVDYLNTVKEENKLSPDKHEIHILGIVVNKCDKRTNMSSAITEVVEKLYSEKGYIFNTKLPVDTSVSKAQAEKTPISISYSKSRIFEALTDLANEVIQRADGI